MMRPRLHQPRVHQPRLLHACLLALLLGSLPIGCSNTGSGGIGAVSCSTPGPSSSANNAAGGAATASVSAPGTPSGPATPEEAKRFVESADKELLELGNKLARAQWVAATFITTDTEALSADTYTTLIARTMTLAKDATRFDKLQLPADTARRLLLLKLASIPLPAPSSPEEQKELTQITTGMEATYGRGKYCPPGGKPCQDINALSRIMAQSRDPKELLEAWQGWHAIAPPIKPKYARFVELGNKGARDLGYKDLGALWRTNYDMPADAFATELDRLWAQVRPLYEALHAHVRASLVKKYGSQVVPEKGPIPAHLLGNMWAQEWGNIYPLMGMPASGSGYDLTALLKARNVDAKGMAKYGEGFFTSLGFAPLPDTFWERSLFTKPRDRDVVCHASAWDVDSDQDVRIKMCIEITGEDFVTIHHELGHNFYQRAYRQQPYLYRGSANDGFHEAIGDAVALSVTPAYLVKLGLLKQAPGPGGDLEFLMRQALDKVAFLPFGLLVDQWRWQVFSGAVTPDHYNAAWWDLRRKYQGVSEPIARTEADFDPGAKYHVPANTPYARYFLARILQFQFHRAMCRAAGYTGPLHACSIYDNKAVGEKLAKMLEMGQSRPWPDALEALTGERHMDATAMLDYFAPLKQWLDEQNKGRPVGY
jgi:peptidyl-dipeptidase A